MPRMLRLLLVIFGILTLLVWGVMAWGRYNATPPVPAAIFVSNLLPGETLFRARLVDDVPPQPLSPAFGNIASPVFSPDGKWIAFTGVQSRAGAALYRMRADGRDLQPLTGETVLRNLTWSPDSRWIVYAAWEGDYANLYRMRGDLPASKAVQTREAITSGLNHYSTPTWSADGEWIAFVASHAGDSDILRVRPDGSDLQPITNDEFADAGPVWLPDGAWIAFASTRGSSSGSHSLYRVNPAGTVIEPLPNLIFFEPAWSLDGRLVAFTMGGDVYAVRSDRMDQPHSSDLLQLTTFHSAEFDPAFAPPVKGYLSTWLLLVVGVACLFGGAWPVFGV